MKKQKKQVSNKTAGFMIGGAILVAIILFFSTIQIINETNIEININKESNNKEINTDENIILNGTELNGETKMENQVEIKTNKGTIIVQLDKENAPITVENFLNYVDKQFYDGTILHRIIEGFMIQGGGFTPDASEKETNEPIVLESQNGLRNDRGTIAMARTMVPDSATSQFFINVVDNNFLNYQPGNEGYAVFGKVIEGMDVVDKIVQVQTGSIPMPDWPTEPVIIESIRRK